MVVPDPKKLLLRVESKGADISAIVRRAPVGIKVGRWELKMVDLIDRNTLSET